MWFRFRHGFSRIDRSNIFILLNVQLFANQIITSRVAQPVRHQQQIFDNAYGRRTQEMVKYFDSKKKKKLYKFFFVRKQNLRNTETEFTFI